MISRRAKKAGLHFHIRSKLTKVPQTYATRDEADSTMFSQMARWPDLDGVMEVVPCLVRHKKGAPG